MAGVQTETGVISSLIRWTDVIWTAVGILIGVVLNDWINRKD
jgi:hypothetical protein